jgi:hypothetical protein
MDAAFRLGLLALAVAVVAIAEPLGAYHSPTIAFLLLVVAAVLALAACMPRSRRKSKNISEPGDPIPMLPPRIRQMDDGEILCERVFIDPHNGAVIRHEKWSWTIRGAIITADDPEDLLSDGD